MVEIRPPPQSLLPPPRKPLLPHQQLQLMLHQSPLSPGAVEAEVVAKTAVEIPTEEIEAEEILEVVQIQTLRHLQIILLVKSLTRRVQEPLLMSLTMPVLSTGRRAGTRLTAPTHSTATGSASLLQEPEL